MIIPEHVPVFARRTMIQKAAIDPRTFVVIGDTETALSAVDTLRTNYTGRIVLVPTSPYGAFENHDILTRKFTPLQKNELFLVEPDFFERANVEVMNGAVTDINLYKRFVRLKGNKTPIRYDKVLFAWGAEKKKLSNKGMNNVYYLEDKHSHAKVHNEILLAKTIVVMGGSFEAYQTVASIREYLDSIGYTDTKIILFDTEATEV